ncbi:MAG TPA: DNA repair protein RecN [Victivallales bacterium]|nr:DNA repair protein RecN [Victivallales bacterium]
MIEWLKINNLALVQDAEIEFKKGLNIISGETGAGKTVIINAISLLLGKRADKSVIRKDAARCDLSAGFKIPASDKAKFSNLLDKYCLPFSDDSIIIRKVITQSSSRNFVNDISVTLPILNELRELLVDFHGPTEHQSLLKHSKQLEFLDIFGNLLPLKRECLKLYQYIREIEKEIFELKDKLPDAIEAEYLKRLINEIESVSPEQDEDETLNKKYSIAANSKNILELISNSYGRLYDSEESVFNTLTQLNRDFSNYLKIDHDSFSKFSDNIHSLTEQIKELAYDMEDYSSNIELDENELRNIEDRLNAVSTLKIKYGPTINDIYISLKKAVNKLEELENFEYTQEELRKKLEESNSKYNSLAEDLSFKRKKIGNEFIKQTIAKLHKLGFLKSAISIKYEKTVPSSTGTDKIDIQFSANPGEQLGPLRNVASSGELSRVMLAIKTVLSNADSIPTLIFDEIDANIGGEIAGQVGQELLVLGKQHQILCISHLAQVASFADSHYSVSKSVIDGRTFTSINVLNKNDRIDELARMLGGSFMAKKHAKEMLTNK